MTELEQFKADRNAALLSMDENILKAYFRKYHVKIPDNPMVFWGAVHKAVTGCCSLPLEHRRASKAWLDERGFKSLDDGDL